MKNGIGHKNNSVDESLLPHEIGMGEGKVVNLGNIRWSAKVPTTIEYHSRVL